MRKEPIGRKPLTSSRRLARRMRPLWMLPCGVLMIMYGASASVAAAVPCPTGREVLGEAEHCRGRAPATRWPACLDAVQAWSAAAWNAAPMCQTPLRTSPQCVPCRCHPRPRRRSVNERLHHSRKRSHQHQALSPSGSSLLDPHRHRHHRHRHRHHRKGHHQSMLPVHLQPPTLGLTGNPQLNLRGPLH